MAIFPVSSLLAEQPVVPPPPKPRQLKLPPRPSQPPSEPNDTSATRTAPRATSNEPRRQQQASTATARSVARQQAERDARQADAERAQEQANSSTVVPYDGQGGQGGQGGQEGGGERGHARDGEASGAGGTGSAGLADLASDELDAHMLAGLLPSGADDGIFEVLLPGGGKLGVAVDIGQRATSFLLMPSTERLRMQIKKKKMELENALERRMETQVRLTVL